MSLYNEKGEPMIEDEEDQDLQSFLFESEGKTYAYADAVKIDGIVSIDDGEIVYQKCGESIITWLMENNVKFGDCLILLRSID